MLLQAALNGDRSRVDHPFLPASARHLASDSVACVQAGAGAVHLHPRGDDGAERLDAATVDAVVSEVRAACGVPVGVSTGAWIEPELSRRLQLIGEWHEPDYASVNVAETGFEQVMQALTERGIGIEAGIATVEDAVALSKCAARVHLTRILVEPVEVGADHAIAMVSEIHEALSDFDQSTPRLQHGDGDATWILIEDAIRNGHDTRVGFEDTLHGPRGEQAHSNRDLVEAAQRLIFRLFR